MASQIDYSAEAWQESCGHFPLRDRPREELLLLQRHWMWANTQREAMEQEFGTEAESLEPGPLMMATKGISFMLVWYGLLWGLLRPARKTGASLCSACSRQTLCTSRMANSYSMTGLPIWWAAYRRSRFGACIAGSGVYSTRKWCAAQWKTTQRRRLQTPPRRRNLIP